MLRRNSPLLFLVTLLAGLLLATTPVQAHDTLVSVTPEDGAEVEVAPDQAVLTFSGEPVSVSPQAILQKDGEPVEIDPVTIDGYDLVVPLPELDAGSYTIIFSVVSSDGHRIDGTTAFDVTAGIAGGQSGSDEASDESTAGEATVSPEPEGNGDSGDDSAATDSSDASDVAESESGGAATWIRWAGIVIVVLGGIAIISRIRRNRSS